MKLYLVRHGETEWNKLRKVQGHADIPLNERGIYLAEKTAEGLAKVSFDLAYTSPLVRAKKTAEIILKGKNIPVYEDIRIQEIGFGAAEGMCCQEENRNPDSEAFNLFFTDTRHYEVFEGGETFGELGKRIEEFLLELCSNQNFRDKTILLSTHGAALKAMLNFIKNQQDISLFWENGVPANCAVTEVEVSESGMNIIEENKIYY